MAENHHIDPEPPPLQRMQPDLSRRAAFLLLFSCVIALYWKLALTDQFAWFAGPENAQQVLPAFQFQATEWHRGRIPLWDPNTGGGQPIIQQHHAGSANPLNWVVFALPLKDGRIRHATLNWYFVVIHLMGAWFAYKLARELGCRRWCAVAVGVVFTACGWFAAAESPHLLNGALWAPLVLLYQLRAMGGRARFASAALSGFFLGISWLSGDSRIPLLVTLASAGVWLCAVAGNRLLLATIPVFLLMAAAAGSLRFLPALQFGGLFQEWAAPIDPQALWGALLPGRGGPFLGVTALSLMVVGVVSGWRRAGVCCLAVVALAGLMLSIFETSDALLLFGLGAAMLVSFGFDALLEHDCTRWFRSMAAASLAVGIAIIAVQYIGVEIRGFPGNQDPRMMMIALAALIWAALSFAVLRSSATGASVAWSALGLILLEASNFAGFSMPTYLEKDRVATLEAMKRHADIAEFIRSQPGSLRVEVDEKLVPYNFGAWFSIPQIADGSSSEQKRLMSAAYFIGKAPTEFHTVDRFASSSGLKVFSSPDVLPRVFAVHEPDRLQAGTSLPVLEQCGGRDEVDLAAYAPNRVRIRAVMACRGMVILNDSWSTGWRAYVDGRDTQIFQAYEKLRGVEVPAGPHEIEFRFKPWSIVAGALLTGLTIIFAAGVAIAQRRRRTMA